MSTPNWTLHPKNGRVVMCGDAKIATVANTPGNPPEAWENAKLIAAAPELAECLRDLRDFQNGPPLSRYAIEWNEAMEKAAELLQRVGA